MEGGREGGREAESQELGQTRAAVGTAGQRGRTKPPPPLPSVPPPPPPAFPQVHVPFRPAAKLHAYRILVLKVSVHGVYQRLTSYPGTGQGVRPHDLGAADEEILDLLYKQVGLAVFVVQPGHNIDHQALTVHCCPQEEADRRLLACELVEGGLDFDANQHHLVSVNQLPPQE